MDSPTNSEKSSQQPASGQGIAIKRRCRRITMQDADWIANQVARGLSESHAVSLLNKFSANQWFSWKSKGKRAGKIANILTRTIAGRMSNLVSEIELAATGGNDACGRPVRHDHRAAAMLAGLHDDRFRNNPPGNTTTNNMLAIGGDASQVNKLIAMFAGQVRGQVDDKPAAPALPAPTDKPIDV